METPVNKLKEFITNNTYGETNDVKAEIQNLLNILEQNFKGKLSDFVDQVLYRPYKPATQGGRKSRRRSASPTRRKKSKSRRSGRKSPRRTRRRY